MISASDEAAGSRVRAFRGSVLHFLRDPGNGTDDSAFEYFEDGVLVVQNGRVLRVGRALDVLPTLADAMPITQWQNRLIVPGFIDCHVHYSQIDAIASYGGQLLSWLDRYTFPIERDFEDGAHCAAVAESFLDEMLRNGTTTALVFATVHPQSVDALFAAARARNVRLISGKVLMDRNCPDYLRDTPESAYRDSKSLIERWHGQERLRYALTPRFAGSSSEAQLERVSQLAREHPDVYVHTHVAENRDEVAWVAELFPWSRSYLDVYDRYGLVRERAVYAHGIYLDATDRDRLAETKASLVFCPSSNLFLGSGLFDLDDADKRGVRVGIGTDVGAGTSFGLLQTLSDAYKVLQLRGQSCAPLRAFYLATLGGAAALDVADQVGSFVPGREADFVVLDFQATPLLARRVGRARDLAERLFVLMTLGDDRAVAATYIMGRLAHGRDG